MKSIAFPNMFSTTNTNLVSDKEATLSNLRLVILSVKTTLFGDPQFGTAYNKIYFEQNNAVLRDVLADELYMAIKLYMPQIKMTRKNIVIESDGVDITATINCMNVLDSQEYQLKLNLLTTEGTVL